MKKKILFFMPNLLGGGAEKVTVNIIRLLDKNFYDIHLVLVEQKGEYLSLIPKEVKIYNLKSKKTIYSTLKLRKHINLIQPDIVYSSLLRGHIALYLSLLCYNNKLPYIILRSPNSPKLLLENNELSLPMKFLIEKSYKNANLVLAQTPEMKEELQLYHKVDKKKVQVFLNPLDTNMIQNVLKDNDNNPFSTDHINIIAAGRLTKQKGFDTLIKALKIVVSKNDRFLLSIIGKDDGEKENLIMLVNDLKLKKYVNFLGFQDNPYLYYKYADLFVLSSRWEGLPNAVLENLYFKKPIIATKCIPFMNQLINDTQNGFLVEVDNEIQMANSILAYKEIKNFSTDTNPLSDVNKLFNKI